MNEDELIYRIRFEGDTTDISSLIDPNALQSLVDLGKEIEITKEQLDSYQKQVKLGFPLSEEDRKNVEQLKLKLNDLRKEYQENQKAIANNDKALKANSNTYNGLVERNKALSQAMRELPLDDTTGALQRMQAEYNANNDALKQFDASMGNHQRNVGNYKDAFEGLSGVFGLLPSSMQGLSVAFAGVGQALDFAEKTTKEADGGFKAFFKTLMANPIGLIIIGVTALIGILSKLKPVTEALEKVFAVLGATLDTAVQYIEALISGTDRSTISLKNNTIAALNNLQAQKNLANQIRIYNDESARLYADEKRFLRISEDVTKSEKERIEAFQNVQRTREAALVNELEKSDASIRALKNEGAEMEKYNEAVTHHKKLNTDLVDLQQRQARELAEFKEQFKKTDTVVNTGLNEQIQLQKKLAEIYAQQADEFEKQASNYELLQNLDTSEVKLQANRNTLLLDIEREFQNEMTNQRIQSATERGDLLKALEIRMQQEVNQLTVQFMNGGLSQAEAYAKAKAQIEIKYAKEIADTNQAIAERDAATRLQIAQSLGNSLATLEATFFEKSKAFAVAKAIIDTYAAAVAAFKDTPGPIFVRAAAAAATIAAGIANVRNMLKTQPGSTAGTVIPTANMGPAMPMGMIGSAFNPSQAMRFGPLTTGAAGSAAPFNARENQGITVFANVDRKGLAIAVREGERQIKTQQFTFAQ